MTSGVYTVVRSGKGSDGEEGAGEGKESLAKLASRLYRFSDDRG